MGSIRRYALIALLLLAGTFCSAQSKSVITDPILKLKDDKIHIVYDILNSDSSEFFNIRLEITDSAGNVIDAHTFNGDIGSKIQGGDEKCIIWNFQADEVRIDGDFYIQIYAVPAPREYSRASLMLQSALLPGLGLSRLDRGPHWIKGVVGYGCIAGSVVLNRMAVSTYEEYKVPGSAENASELFDKAKVQDNISEVLAFTALGIWITDMVWTFIATHGKDTINEEIADGLSVATSFDPNLRAPLLSLRYRF
jgi:hypothetical protein